MKQMNEANMQDNRPTAITAKQVAGTALALPWLLWALCLITNIFVFGPLGFMSLVPCGILVFIFTTRKQLSLKPTDRYPGKLIAMRIVAGFYALPFIPFALFVLLRGLE